MSVLERPSRERPQPTRPPRRRLLRYAVVAALLVLGFLLGVAFARTLDERPGPAGDVTEVRTLTPLPQEPPVRTVTVTVTTPSP